MAILLWRERRCPRSRRKRQHPSCPADAHRHNADPRASKRKNSLLGQSRRKRCFATPRDAPTENLEQDSDIHASAEYRRSACAALARRALAQAASGQRAAKGTAR